VSDTEVIVPGQAFYLGIEMAHDEGWHSYWTNPGTGMPTKVSWELPEGFEIGKELSPIPKVKEDVIGNLHEFYDTVYHIFQVTPPSDLSAKEISFKGNVSWLQCVEDRCDPPQKAAVELTLAIGDQAKVNEDTRAFFDMVLADQPKFYEAWTVEMAQTEETYTFTLTPGEGANKDPGAIYVFEEEQLLAAATPKVTKDGDKFIVTTTKEDIEEIAALKGYLFAPNGWLAASDLSKTMTFSKEAGEGAAAGGAAMSGAKPQTLSLWKALFLAFVGGMILNLMPCVFPVLSIKVLGFVEQAGEDPLKVKLHGLMFGAGVLVSCLILASIIIGINLATGQDNGWGSHMSHPPVAAVVIILMFVLGLNLSGLFEMGTSLMNTGGGLMQKKGYSGSFFSGVLTTVVATPCSGPFLGAVMGYTFSQPIPIALILFSIFAIGVATPYVLLSFFPQLVNKMPRPGAWMETFKQIMAFPMFAAAIFFLRGFAKKTGDSGVIWLLTALLTISIGLWIYGKWATPIRSKGTRRRGIIFGALFALLGGY
ncbi:MAG: protein-disulfide reductase DsbD family protein, partial [Verrucomicrobiales bacterium]